MLQALAPLKQQAEESVLNNLSEELYFDEGTKQSLLSAYQASFPNYPAVLQDSLIKITNNKNQSAYLPFNWFTRIKHCRDFIVALTEYSAYVDQLKVRVDDSVMRSLPMVNWSSSLEGNVVAVIESFIEETIFDDGDQARFRDFLDGSVWLDPKSEGSNQLTGKKLNRQPSDYISSCITTICKLINDTAGRLDQFIHIYINDGSVRSLIDELYLAEPTYSSSTAGVGADINFVNTGFNKIFYGAPGTGKSYSISLGRDEKQLIRTVFHPDTQYSDFVGCLKPIMLGDSVAYQFRPGPFTEAIVKAVSKPSTSYSLVIEEINRAAAAAVFGEIFQLLDREVDGSSTYSIDVSDPDLLSYLNQHTNGFFHNGKLKLPSNLSLLATMNSSDQAVMPMDTAFKRRWQFEYLRIDYNKASEGMLEFMVSEVEGKVLRSFRWADFARTINECLSAEHIPEDRLLGHRFISENELESNPENTLKGKLFMYLWDDVLRHGQHTVIFRDSVIIDGKPEELVNFGQLVVAFEQGEVIFNDAVELRLKALSELHAQSHTIETAAAESQDAV